MFSNNHISVYQEGAGYDLTERTNKEYMKQAKHARPANQ